MTDQLALFAPPPVAEPPAPEPPDPWTWRRDYLETDWDEGLRGFLCQPEPGLIASVRTEGRGWVWELAYGDKIVSNGGAMTMAGAQSAAKAAWAAGDGGLRRDETGNSSRGAHAPSDG